MKTLAKIFVISSVAVFVCLFGLVVMMAGMGML